MRLSAHVTTIVPARRECPQEEHEYNRPILEGSGDGLFVLGWCAPATHKDGLHACTQQLESFPRRVHGTACKHVAGSLR